jgi:hypothetical protein
MEERTSKGLAFANALKASDEWTAAALARQLKVNPQRITHWQRRGVATKYAHAVASLLRVPVDSISGVEKARYTPLTGGVAEPDPYYGLTPEKQLAAVMAIADEASPADAIAFAEYFLARAKAGLAKK